VFHIAISYDIYLPGGGSQATLCNTAAAISVLVAAIVVVVVGKGGAGNGAMVIEVVGSGWCHAVDQLSARDPLSSVQCAWCMLRNKPNRH